MATTVREAFEIAMALIDEVLTDGTISTTETADYSSKTPYIVNMLQRELIKISKKRSVEEYTITNEDDLNKWQKYTLPADFRTIDEIVLINEDSQIKSIRHNLFGETDIYIYFTELGTARMSYIPIPTPITSLDQTLVIDDDLATTALPNGIAWHLMAAEQNEELSKLFKERYNLTKFEGKVNTPASEEKIINVYDDF